MKDICQKFAQKILLNINSLLFLYGGAQINFELSFLEQANSIDKKNNEMKIIVYNKENEGFVCPKCGEKIELDKEKINNIISSNNNIKDTITGIKIQIENIIKNNKINLVNVQLKNINLILNTLDEELKKNNKNLENLFEDNDRKNNDNNKNNLTIELNKYKNENISLKKEIELLKNDSVKANNLQIELDKKNKEINDLRNIITFRIISVDHTIDEIVKCSKTDFFSTVVNKLTQKYEKLENTENYFALNGNLVKMYLTINDNKIKEGDKIICFFNGDII